VLKSILTASVIATGLVVAAASSPASAGIMAPDLGKAGTSPLVQVHWKCGPWACHWVPNYRGPIHPYARHWGPPRRPGCWWHRNYYGRWIAVCP
jgi:hypothetical protein